MRLSLYQQRPLLLASCLLFSFVSFWAILDVIGQNFVLLNLGDNDITIAGFSNYTSCFIDETPAEVNQDIWRKCIGGNNEFVGFWCQPTPIGSDEGIMKSGVRIAGNQCQQAGSDGENNTRDIIEKANYPLSLVPYVLTSSSRCAARFTTISGGVFLIGWLAVIGGFGSRNPLSIVIGGLLCLFAYMIATTCISSSSYGDNNNRTQTATEEENYDGLKTHVESLAFLDSRPEDVFAETHVTPKSGLGDIRRENRNAH
jgi:hypothetical protein